MEAISQPGQPSVDQDFFAEYASQPGQQAIDHKASANATSLTSDVMDEISKQIEEQSLRHQCLALFIVCSWLILTAFTLVGFVYAFTGKEQMFRYSFFGYIWFMTITNLPPIMRTILKSLRLYHDKMYKFDNLCSVICHVSIYCTFLSINIINSFLLLTNYNEGVYVAFPLFGIYTFFLGLRLGAYLSIRLRSRFHLFHFSMFHYVLP